jgi:putative redox protein
MKDSVSLTLRENMAFDVEINGHKMIIDTAADYGGNDMGPRPKSLMLAALGGCTGMDMASILRKMKIDFKGLRIKVDGNVTHDHPRHFDHMHIIYYVSGKDLPRDKVEHAASLSQEKYCGVTHNYRASMKITHEIVYE